MAKEQKPIKFSEDQKEAANPNNNVWVQANAGTGKTQVLAGRLLRIFFRYMQTDINKMPGILCLTYTEAGVGEMKTRILDTIKTWAVSSDDFLRETLEDVVEGRTVSEKDIKNARKIFFYFIDHPEMLKICTIHGFCSDVLRRFSLEADLPPSWSVVSGFDQNVLLEKAFERIINNEHANERTREALDEILSLKTENDLEDIYKLLVKKYKTIFRVGDNIKEYRDYFEEKIKTFLNRDESYNIPADKTKLTDIVNKTLAFANDPQYAEVKDVYELIAKTTQQYIDDPDTFDEYKKLYLATSKSKSILQPGTQVSCIKSVSYKRSKNKNKQVAYLKNHPDVYEEELERVKKVAEYNAKYKLYKHSMALLDLSIEFERIYKQIKQDRNVLDFDDLILYATHLFENSEMTNFVLSQLDTAIGFILVDEAQDTSLQQWQIFNALRDNLVLNSDAVAMVVGDTKQSIFGFQEANPIAFATSREDFDKKMAQSANVLHQVNLTENFRSLSPILNFVDFVFRHESVLKYAKDVTEPKKDKDTESDDEKAEEEKQKETWKTRHVSARTLKKKESGGIVEMHKVFQSESTGEELKKEYADYIAEEIRKRLEDKEIKPSDITVLVKNRNSVVTYLIRKLKQLNIDVAGEDKVVLNDFLPVRDLLNIIRLNIDKTDNYSLACILKGPLFRLDENKELYDWCREVYDINLKEKEAKKYPRTTLLDIVKAHNEDIWKDLMDLLRQCDKMAPYSFFNYVLNKNDNRNKMIAAMGKHIVEPLEEFLTLCLIYERTKPGTNRDFLKWFITSETEVKRNVNISSGVKIMTVHGSKGLSAKIIFLIDTMTKKSHKDTLIDLNFLHAQEDNEENKKYELWLWNNVSFFDLPEEMNLAKINYGDKKELAEYYRLLYVALTRAQDELYIYGLKTENGDNVGDGDRWFQTMWPLVQEIATDVPSTKINEETIRITDDTEVEKFFTDYFARTDSDQ